MNIKSAIIIGTNILKNQYIQTAQLDTEILMAKAIDEDRKYIILNDDIWHDGFGKEHGWFINKVFYSSRASMIKSFVGTF